jgi:hypothetical protein
MNLEALLTDPQPAYARTCKFGSWVATLGEEDRHAVWRSMGNDNVSTRHIYRILKSVGCPSAESSVRSHRRGECQNCERNNNV